MTTPWKGLDAGVSRAVDGVWAERVRWLPKSKRTSGAYSAAQEAPADPVRPPRDLLGITSWQSEGVPVDPARGGAEISSGSLLIDFDRAVFAGDFAAHGIPAKGDRIEILNEAPGNRIVEVTRAVDDGGARVQVWCSLVKS
jgi:hypothetical protein